MGSIPLNSKCFCCSKKSPMEDSKEIFLDSSNPSLKNIVLIQSIFRGFLIRKNVFTSNQIKEVSIDYSTEHFENTSMITKLNHLLPKFELTDKEEYEISNTSNKIMAILYPNKSVYKGMINSKDVINFTETLGSIFDKKMTDLNMIEFDRILFECSR